MAKLLSRLREQDSRKRGHVATFTSSAGALQTDGKTTIPQRRACGASCRWNLCRWALNDARYHRIACSVEGSRVASAGSRLGVSTPESLPRHGITDSRYRAYRSAGVWQLAQLHVTKRRGTAAAPYPLGRQPHETPSKAEWHHGWISRAKGTLLSTLLSPEAGGEKEGGQWGGEQAGAYCRSWTTGLSLHR
ncbi:hypothetical protein G7046_g9773 [Stylonectria norvegica]|nr:hypothetical protein G7046_g9773 [Stylonectria norvegica]